MSGLITITIVSCFIFACSNADYNATFAIPFEISFSNVNEFRFSTNYLENFIDATSSFFSVQNDNITISFIRPISNNNYIYLGFTINVITFNDEDTIRNTNILLYHTFLMSRNNLPNIIGIEMKYKSCSKGKYSTFYHYDIECQWLCDYLSIYNDDTNECKSISNTTTTIYVKEDHQLKFIGYGYILSVLCCGCVYCMVRKDKIG